MSKIAFVFSGQGAQAPGMGKELYDCSPAAKAVFDLADSIRPGTSQQCFEGTQEELNVTINTQPCLFACDLAAAKAAQERGIQPDCAAGFSLGEAAAVAFSGMLTEAEAFSMVCKRAELMNEAAQKNPGAMAAVMKLSPQQVELSLIHICLLSKIHGVFGARAKSEAAAHAFRYLQLNFWH